MLFAIIVIIQYNHIFLQTNLTMDQQSPAQQHQFSQQQKILSLSQICQKLATKTAQPDPLLRQYISTYIESHHRSDQYFTTLCENRFFMLMFENAEKLQESTCILECLNLLLTNTKNSHELVYFLSQNAMHQYLFGLNILKHDQEFIEYYIQLLKTILMKISQCEENKSLIRMFCNNKYPTFPLLTYTTILASDSNQLTRVTAQQCILILVGMINEKKIYELYLSQPPMLIFVIRLATEYLKTDSDHEGICKYFADLMYELRCNRIPLFFISNILCNVIIVASLPSKSAVALSFIQMLTKSIEIRILQHKGLNGQSKSQVFYSRKSSHKSTKLSNMLGEASCDELIIICATFYRILVKFMTNKYLNASYLTAYISLCFTNGKAEQNQISLPLKVTYPGAQALWKMMQDFNFKKYFDEQYPTSQVQFKLDFLVEIQAKINQYSVSKDFFKTKETYLKKFASPTKSAPPSVSFFGRIFNRGTTDQLNNQYIKYASDFSNINFTKGQPISSNIGKQFNPAGSPFFSQFTLLYTALKNGLKYDKIKTGQESDTVQPNQIHFNDIRSIWSFTHSNMEIIHQMTQKFVQFINVQSPQVRTLVVPKIYIPPSYLFLGQFKDYLTFTIHQHINREPKNAELMGSITMLISLSKICSLLNIQLNQTPYIALITQITVIHQQLQNCLFQNGFHDVVQYIKSKNKKVLMEMEEKDKIKRKSSNIQNESMVSQKMQKKSGVKIKVKPGLTFIKICSFESIQKIMDPHIKPLLRYFQVKWRETILKKSSAFTQFYEQTLFHFKVTYFGKSGCVLSFVKLMKPPTIVLRVDLGGKKLLQIDITQLEGIRKNSIDNRVLQFGGGNVENVKTQTAEMGAQIIESFKKCKFSYEECITNATLQYLSSTNETLNIKSKQMGRQSIRMSQTFQTPQ